MIGQKRGKSVTPTLAEFVPDLAEWARSWRYEDRDIAPGEQIVACFTPLLQHLLDLGLSRKTRNRHRHNLWRLGGELIRAIQESARLRKQPISHLIASMLGDDGGPLPYRQRFRRDSGCLRLDPSQACTIPRKPNRVIPADRLTPHGGDPVKDGLRPAQRILDGAPSLRFLNGRKQFFASGHEDPQRSC